MAACCWALALSAGVSSSSNKTILASLFMMTSARHSGHTHVRPYLTVNHIGTFVNRLSTVPI
jgi:hypothetical protein